MGLSFDSSIGGSLVLAPLSLGVARCCLKWRFEEGDAGKRARVHGTPIAVEKNSIISGAVYLKALILSPQTCEDELCRVSSSDNARETERVFDVPTNVTKSTPLSRSIKGCTRASLLYLYFVSA